MKIRQGFVSNSSSASFIVSFKSTLPIEDVKTMVRTSSEWLDRWWDVTEKEQRDWPKHGIKTTKTTIKKIPAIGLTYVKEANGVYEIKPDTTMFNDWMDIPEWKFIRALSEGRVPNTELSEIIQTTDEYDDCHNKVSFNKICWEYEYDVLQKDKYGKTKPNETQKAVKQQNEYNYEYLAYLASINSSLSEDEEIELAKQHLDRM